jgi:hypothetical protein
MCFCTDSTKLGLEAVTLLQLQKLPVQMLPKMGDGLRVRVTVKEQYDKVHEKFSLTKLLVENEE